MIISGGPSGRSWNQFKVIISPVELFDIFEELDIYIYISGLVSENYSSTSKNEFIDTFTKYWERIVSGKEWNNSSDNLLFHRFLMTDNRNDVEIRLSDQQNKKLLREINPVIWIDPLSIHYQDYRLDTNDPYPKGNIGINFIFPKVIAYYNNYRQLANINLDYINTESFNNSLLYNNITNSISEKSKNVKIWNGAKYFNPKICVTRAARDKINNNYYLIENNLEIK